jgi:hypothetical protein
MADGIDYLEETCTGLEVLSLELSIPTLYGESYETTKETYYVPIVNLKKATSPN